MSSHFLFLFYCCTYIFKTSIPLINTAVSPSVSAMNPVPVSLNLYMQVCCSCDFLFFIFIEFPTLHQHSQNFVVLCLRALHQAKLVQNVNWNGCTSPLGLSSCSILRCSHIRKALWSVFFKSGRLFLFLLFCVVLFYGKRTIIC